MTVDHATDEELLRAYQSRRDEGAFAELVRRHVDLVFGTAYRISGNRSAAEEISQNVFLILARKSAGLTGDGGLAGWLHRTAILEARHQQRGELRRRQREESAGQLGTVMSLQESPSPSLEGTLDEALLELPERDRRVLLLRYFDGLDFRQLGLRQGVSADAAQKRAERALATLSKILQRRGFATATAATAATALQSAALITAPAHLTTTITAALAATALTSGTFAGLVLAKLMTLTKVQTAAICLLLASAPVGYQWQAAAAAQAQVRNVRDQLGEITHQIQQAHHVETMARRQADASAAALLAGRAELQRTIDRIQAGAGRNADDIYLWSETADFVRIPKSVAEHIHFERSIPLPGTQPPQNRRLDPVGVDGSLSEALTEALGISTAESTAIARAFQRANETLQQQVRSRAFLTEQIPGEFGPVNGPHWTLITPALPEGGTSLRESLRTQLTEILGSERSTVLWQQAERTFIDGYNSLGESEQVQTLVLSGDQQMTLWNGLRKPGESFSEWGTSSGPLNPERLSSALREALLQYQSLHPESKPRP